MVLPGTQSTGSAIVTSQLNASDCDLLVDGTQLINETKALVADLLNVSPSQISASFRNQPSEDKYKYAASYGAQSGFVTWTVVNGQIVEDNLDGF